MSVCMFFHMHDGLWLALRSYDTTRLILRLYKIPRSRSPLLFGWVWVSLKNGEKAHLLKVLFVCILDTIMINTGLSLLHMLAHQA